MTLKPDKLRLLSPGIGPCVFLSVVGFKYNYKFFVTPSIERWGWGSMYPPLEYGYGHIVFG